MRTASHRRRFAAYVSVSPAGTAASRVATIDLATHKTTISPLHGTTVLGAIDGRVIWVTVAGEIMETPLNADGSLGQATRLLEDVMVRPGGGPRRCRRAERSSIRRACS